MSENLSIKTKLMNKKALIELAFSTSSHIQFNNILICDNGGSSKSDQINQLVKSIHGTSGAEDAAYQDLKRNYSKSPLGQPTLTLEQLMQQWIKETVCLNRKKTLQT